MKWETTNPAEAAVGVGIVLVAFTLIQTICEYFFFGSRDPLKIKKNLTYRKWAILAQLVVTGAIVFTGSGRGGFYVSIFGCYLVFLWWFSGWLALQISRWHRPRNADEILNVE